MVDYRRSLSSVSVGVVGRSAPNKACRSLKFYYSRSIIRRYCSYRVLEVVVLVEGGFRVGSCRVYFVGVSKVVVFYLSD
jgi:hypothetical protein